MKVAYVLYPGFTALDLIGPYEVISRWPGVEISFLAGSLEPVRSDRGLTVGPTATPATLAPVCASWTQARSRTPASSRARDTCT